MTTIAPNILFSFDEIAKPIHYCFFNFFPIKGTALLQLKFVNLSDNSFTL